jgi:hypothetical protein
VTIENEVPMLPRGSALAPAMALAMMAAGCGRAASPPPAAESSSVAAAVAACAADSLHPATAAPAAGLWVGERAVPSIRVAAMVGAASPDSDRPRLTRRVETLELRAGASPIRLATDTATLALDLLPQLREADGPLAPAPTGEPAAVYAISPLVLLASYEPCAASADEPRIRYLRRDARGVVATDLMLRRESAETKGTLR